ncbi:HNH endonuclease signature motif containing protein [Williamsia sp. CHRR-6]|uniref:HNH endonuclease signature motif containing protein n=1 Tax=Williamsia sp. CHRR-6 TaxID=2835871 RepID=UPI001BD91C3D|nr:HNH endonuclease signature motif containing protein [Williamsia sp. CHRR-6]MBT0567368.1 DUF222 domain-containing protein [Williamsia sp. CHRR-6]
MNGKVLTAAVDTLVDAATDVAVASDDDVIATIRAAVRLRATADDLLARSAGHCERMGTAKRCGMKTAELLVRNGCAPAVAARAMRVGRALDVLDSTGRYSRDAVVSGEHIAAVVTGVAHAARRCRAGLESDLLTRLESQLLAAAVSGAAPAEISNAARAFAIEHEPTVGEADPNSVPAAEDTSLNELSWAQGDDGRLRGQFDLDVLTGERLIAGLDAGSRPRPAPDGTPDPRRAARRHADAFSQLLESGVTAMASTAFAGPTKTDVLVTIPAVAVSDSSEIVVASGVAAHLQWLGPISDISTTLLTCDAVTSVLTYDDNGAPVTITDPQRLFAGPQRRAVNERTKGCVKCGAPPSWCDIHHIIPHSQGGLTVVDNGAPACRTCHIEFHHGGWEVVIGHDRHPWLRPPATIDPRRQLIPSYHRRTLNLDGVAA